MQKIKHLPTVLSNNNVYLNKYVKKIRFFKNQAISLGGILFGSMEPLLSFFLER